MSYLTLVDEIFSNLRDLFLNNLGIVLLDLLLGHGVVVEGTVVLLRWGVESTEEVATVAGVGGQEQLGPTGREFASLRLFLLCLVIIFRTFRGCVIIRSICIFCNRGRVRILFLEINLFMFAFVVIFFHNISFS